MAFGLRHADALAGGDEKFLITPLGGFCIIVVLVLYGTGMTGLAAAIAHKGRLFNLPAAFAFEMAADIIAAMAGSAEFVTYGELFAGIHFFAMETMDAEVVWIVEASMVPRIHNPMAPDLF